MPIGDISTTKQFVNGQLGVDGSDLNAIVGQSSIQSAFYSAQGAGSSPGDSDYLLLLSSGGSFYKLLYSSLFKNQKWMQSSLLPFVNTLTNGDMSIWQWGTSFTNPATASYLADRFRTDYVLGSGGKINAAQTALAGSLVLPNGYSPLFCLRISVNTVQASLAASDLLQISQKVELSNAVKLFGGVSSLQLWVRCNNAGTYTLFLQNANQSQTYKQDFNIGTPNVWTQLQLPNIAAMPTGSGTWGTNPPDFSYLIGICLGAGSNFQDSTQTQWQANVHVASSSTTNFLATSGNQIDLCLAQHEMGPQCTIYRPDDSLIDTLLKCQRYAMGYSGVSLGSASSAQLASGGRIQFPVTMRATPGVAASPAAAFSVTTGSVGTVGATSAGTAGGMSVQSANIFNASNNWTVGAGISFSALFTAEL